MPSMLGAMDITQYSDSSSESIFGRIASESLIRLNCSELLLGMYVCEVDCSWSAIPFPVGGFHLKTVEDIETLARYCKFVSIDGNKGTVPREARLNKLTVLSSARSAVPAMGSLNIKRDTYPVLYPVKQKIEKAYRLYSRLKKEFLVQTQGLKVASELDLVSLEEFTDGLIDEILGNPQTLIWVLNTDPDVQQENDYCVRAAIWATILARQIGMNKNDIKVLFMGTLLADIGMQQLPENLVQKRGSFSKEEYLAYKKHVELGMQLTADFPNLDERVSSIIRCHHERHDGMGFPRGLQGEQIPELARIANLAYCFERLLKLNANGSPVSPAKALSKLYKQRGLKFPEQLVVELIQVMGVYPLGSLVELSSGEVALVLEQIAEQKLMPKVALLTDNNKSPAKRFKIVKLGDEENSQRNFIQSRSIVGSFPNTDLREDNELGGILKPSNYAFDFCGKRNGFSLMGLRF